MAALAIDPTERSALRATARSGYVANTAREAEDGQCVAFSVNGLNYAVDIMLVQEIRSWSPTSTIPGQHPASMGVMDIRGEVVEVYDLSALLGGAATKATSGHVVLVLALGTAVVGILVDGVSDIIQINDENLQPAPRSSTSKLDGVVKGIVTLSDHMVALLDLSRVIGSSD